MQEKFKKTILIDLDGVLNEYKGEFDINFNHGTKTTYSLPSCIAA